jgi:hypothetical protein
MKKNMWGKRNMVVLIPIEMHRIAKAHQMTSLTKNEVTPPLP